MKCNEFCGPTKEKYFLSARVIFLSTPAEKHDKGEGFKDVIIVYNLKFLIIMALKVKAKEQLMKVGKHANTCRCGKSKRKVEE